MGTAVGETKDPSGGASARRHRSVSAIAPKSVLAAALVAAGLATLGAPLVAQSLRGGSGSLDRQNQVAREHDFTYIDTPDRAYYFQDRGWLVTVKPTPNFRLHAVSFPFARPEVKLFIERLAAQYRRACGEQLVVTSLTRPLTRQPRNASSRSVHPTGMAVDFRRSANRTCRSWLERVLLQMEGSGVLEATRERYPPHYHVAVFPKQYATYVDRVTKATDLVEDGELMPLQTHYVVRRGDTLWGIARAYDTTVDELRKVNYLKSDRIDPGQSLALPGASR